MSQSFFVVGLSHHTADVATREQLAVGEAGVQAETAALREATGGREAVLISTCNRVEVYGVADDLHAVTRAARAAMEARAGRPLGDALYVKTEEDAVNHAFRVASSLDSLVVGEPQILGQVKEAVDAARGAGTLGPLLGRCFTRAFGAAKRVRTETGIAEGSVSVSSVACELAEKIFGALEGRRVLLVGAGEMGEAAAKSLRGMGAELVVVNRSPDKAEALAAHCGGVARGHEALANELVQADVVITSTSANRFVLTTELMKGVAKARRGRPLFLIDIAVPRDVDPRVGGLPGIFLYDVDDLEKVTAQNLHRRKAEAEAAEQIVRAEVLAFESWRKSLGVTPTIVALRERTGRIVRDEIARTTPRLRSLDDRDQKSLDKMADAIVNKLLHQQVMALKAASERGEADALVSSLRQLHGLDEDDDEAPAGAAMHLTPAKGGETR